MNAPSLPEPLPVLAARVGEALRARGQTVAVPGIGVDPAWRAPAGSRGAVLTWTPRATPQ